MKKVRKLLPISCYDIPGMERWLEQQADAGLFPVSIGSWATFTHDGVPGTRFRLEPEGMDATPSEDQLELYRDGGWNYALTVGAAYFLFYTTDPAAPELYTDHESRGLSLERLEKRFLRHRRIHMFLYLLLVLLFGWALFIYRSKFDAQPDPLAKLPLLLLELCNPLILLILASAIFSWRISRRDTRTLCRTCQALKNGLPPPPSPGPSRRMVREQAVSLALVPVLLVTYGTVFLSNHGVFSLPTDQFSRPYVALQSLEQVEVALSLIHI